MNKASFWVVALFAVGCGGTAKIGGGKMGAASAALAASQPTQSSDVNMVSLLFGSMSVKCKLGGEVRMKDFKFNVAAGNGGASTDFGFTAEYANCKSATSDAGDAVFNGTLSVSNLTKASDAGALLQQTLKGRLTVGGAFNDFLDTDLVQELAAGTANGPMVSLVMKGSIANSGGSYSFDESITVASDKIAVDISTK